MVSVYKNGAERLDSHVSAGDTVNLGTRPSTVISANKVNKPREKLQHHIPQEGRRRRPRETPPTLQRALPAVALSADSGTHCPFSNDDGAATSRLITESAFHPPLPGPPHIASRPIPES